MEINHGSVSSYFSILKGDGFSFMWKIERFSALTSGSFITSPEFYLTESKKDLHWYLEFKVVENWDQDLTLGPTIYELNLCNKDDFNADIDFTIGVSLDQKDVSLKRNYSIESFRNFKKINLLPYSLFPDLFKADIVKFICSITVKCGSGTDWVPHRPIELPVKNNPPVLQNEHKIPLLQAHNTSVREKRMDEQFLRHRIQKEMINSISEIATYNSKQRQIPLTINTDDSSDFDTLKQLSIDFKSMFTPALNTDVTIRVEDIAIKAHKMILCARSPVFCRMFEHSTTEAANNEIEVTDVQASIMKKLVNYLYCGEKGRLQYEETCDLYYAADKYEILRLREGCMKDLVCLLDVNNACPMLSLAYHHSDDAFKQQIMDFISKNFNSIVNTESWIELTDKDTKLAALLMRYCAGALTK